MANEAERWQYTKLALREINYKESKWQWIASGLISLFLSIPICYGENTISIMRIVVNTFNTISLAIIAMLFTAYALFQALLNDDLVYEMGKTDLLDITNQSFLAVALLHLSSIIINTILIILLAVLSDDFRMSNYYWLDCTLCCIFICFYISYMFRILIEIRNFSINLYKIFIARNKLSILERKKKPRGITVKKLVELKELVEMELITKEEYTRKRLELINRM